MRWSRDYSDLFSVSKVTPLHLTDAMAPKEPEAKDGNTCALLSSAMCEREALQQQQQNFQRTQSWRKKRRQNCSVFSISKAPLHLRCIGAAGTPVVGLRTSAGGSGIGDCRHGLYRTVLWVPNKDCRAVAFLQRCNYIAFNPQLQYSSGLRCCIVCQ